MKTLSPQNEKCSPLIMLTQCGGMAGTPAEVGPHPGPTEDLSLRVLANVYLPNPSFINLTLKSHGCGTDELITSCLLTVKL